MNKRRRWKGKARRAIAAAIEQKRCIWFQQHVLHQSFRFAAADGNAAAWMPPAEGAQCTGSST